MSEHRIPPDDRESEPEDPMGAPAEDDSAVHPPEARQERSYESPETLRDDETGDG